MKSRRNMPESLETVTSGRFGNRSAIFLENNISMTSQLSLNFAWVACVSLRDKHQKELQPASEHSVTLVFKIHSTSTLNHLIIVLFSWI